MQWIVSDKNVRKRIDTTSPCCVCLCIYCERRMKELWGMSRGSVAPMPSVSVASRRLSGKAVTDGTSWTKQRETRLYCSFTSYWNFFIQRTFSPNAFCGSAYAWVKKGYRGRLALNVVGIPLHCYANNIFQIQNYAFSPILLTVLCNGCGPLLRRRRKEELEIQNVLNFVKRNFSRKYNKILFRISFFSECYHYDVLSSDAIQSGGGLVQRVGCICCPIWTWKIEAAGSSETSLSSSSALLPVPLIYLKIIWQQTELSDL